jgi:hypothetical protein
MSIVACPKCGNKVSSLAKLCLHCGAQRGELGGELSDEQALVSRQRQAREKVYHLNMSSYALITVFLAAFGWYWWETSGFQGPTSAGPYILMGLSAFAYLIVRVLLFQARRKQKELKRLLR